MTGNGEERDILDNDGGPKISRLGQSRATVVETSTFLNSPLSV